MTNIITRKLRIARGKPAYPQIFNPDVEEDTPNPHDYPTNDNGIPLVPQSDVAGKFGGARLLSRGTDHHGRRKFMVRQCVPGHTFRTGDLFAYEMASGRYGVYEVVAADDDRHGAYPIYARDTGYLDPNTETGDLGIDTAEIMREALSA